MDLANAKAALSEDQFDNFLLIKAVRFIKHTKALAFEEEPNYLDLIDILNTEIFKDLPKGVSEKIVLELYHEEPLEIVPEEEIVEKSQTIEPYNTQGFSI